MRRAADCRQGCGSGASTATGGNLGEHVGHPEHHRRVTVFLSSEAIARGTLTRGQLRWNYRQVHRDIYLPKDADRTLWDNIQAAWLWSGRRAVIGGLAAAALHGAKWVDNFAPVELIGQFNHPPAGIIIRRERLSADDVVNGVGYRRQARLGRLSIWQDTCRGTERSLI